MGTIKAIFKRVVKVEAFFGVMSTNTAFEVPLVAGDSGPKLQFTLLDEDQIPIAVSGVGSGVSLFLRRFQEHSRSNGGHEGCSGIDVAGGVWTYDLKDGDVSGSGTYFGDVQIRYSNGVVETAFEAVRFLVRPSNNV